MSFEEFNRHSSRNSNRTAMGLPNFHGLAVLALMTLLLLRCVNSQDPQNYYFASPAGQTRFVPSSSFQASRPPTQAAYLSGSRATGTGAYPQPGSYQEQLLFIANDSKQQQQQQAVAQPLTSSAYSPFGGPLSQTRNPEYYDISPRPFGVASAGGSSNGFTRSKAIRPASSSSGFIPQPQSLRSNVPHQQTQFLAHFNEPNTSTPNRPSFNGLNGSGSRPFGNGGFVPSRSRPAATSYSADAAVAAQSQQQQTSFKSTRNRFQPSSATSTTNAEVFAATEATLPTSSKRFNRFGAGRTSGAKTQPQPSTESAAVAQSQRPSFGRAGNKANGVRGFTPRRPVFISREINEPVNLAKVQRPLSPNGGRVKFDKEKVLKQQAAATSTVFEPSPLLSTSSDDSHSHEYDESLTGSNSGDAVSQEGSFEKLELHGAIETTTLPPTDTTSSSISITTVNSKADDTTNGSGEALDEIVSKEGQTETIPHAKNNNTSEYEYEYVEEDDESTEATEVEAKVQNVTSKTEETTASVPFSESSDMTTEFPRTTANDDEEEDSTVDLLTTAAPETTTQALLNENETNEEPHYESSTDYDDEEEYDEEEESEEDEDVSSRGPETTQVSDKETLDREVVSVVTTKSVVNGSTAFPSPVTPSSTTLPIDEEVIFNENKMRPATDDLEDTEKTVNNNTANEESVSNTTESYVVIASIQTSRSINGARFLPFPAIEQEETKQTLSELERKIHGQKSASLKNAKDTSSEEPADSGEETTEKTNASSSSTESIIDKLDRVQSELSSGLLSGKYPIITEMDVSTPATTTTSGNRFLPNIRKFQPKTTAASKVKVHHFDESEMDELAGLLPAGFKPRSSYKNRKITTSTTTTQAPEMESGEVRKPSRNSTIGRSFKNNAVVVQDVALAGLLPKGYKPPATTETPKPEVKDILNKLKFEDNVDALLPKDYKDKASSTLKPAVTLVDDFAKFLPAGYKPNSSATTKKPVVLINDDISKFLPAGYKPPATEDESDKALGGIIALKADSISQFLPPGYKLNSTDKGPLLPEPQSIDISKLLPKDYKLSATKEQDADDGSKKISFKEVATNLTTLTTLVSTSSSTEKPSDAATTASSGFKVVFPKGIHKRIGANRLTTPRTHESDESGNSPPVVIKKGPPTRATTEFTGWPTPSTTPISIEKLLEQARTVSINFDDLLSSSSTSTTTTSTTTTTTTTPRPTKPGHCTADCDLAATIKIVDGVAWKPELLDHNTLEWKNLAREVEAELNEVYSKAPHLRNWYKKVRIDSFSKGSVLVDYYVELANITTDVNTLEIKQLFHDALTQSPTQATLPHKPETENETDNEDDVSGPFQELKEEKLVKETFLMGKYIIDPAATDFSVIPKSLSPTVEYAEEDLLIPQWAIVVIVIGVGSLIFVVIFGVTVLLNRQKRAKKVPIPLTNDMLNELKINHMGGADNYGADDFYNIDDAWNDTKQPIKPKRFTNSLHGSNGSNIYDSWRSTRHGDYFYDSQKGDSLQRSHHQHQHQHQVPPQQQQHHQHQQPYPQTYGHQYPDAFADAHQMYTYNNHASRTRYPRDYDPDF